MTESGEGVDPDATPSEDRKMPENVDQYFENHEKIGYKPEATFNSIKNFTKILPVDFYVLFQEEAHKANFAGTNSVMFNNLPLVTETKTKTASLKKK